MSKNVRVAIIGAGNCASSLVQGVEYYRNADPADFVPGLMHVALGGYHVSDIQFAVAFDIDKEKVGYDLSEGSFRGMNNTAKFADAPHLGVPMYGFLGMMTTLVVVSGFLAVTMGAGWRPGRGVVAARNHRR